MLKIKNDYVNIFYILEIEIGCVNIFYMLKIDIDYVNIFYISFFLLSRNFFLL